MKLSALAGLAARSAWNRRFVLGMVVVALALSTVLLLGLQRLRGELRAQFTRAVSGTDLIVGPRSAALPLLLQSIFHVGGSAAGTLGQAQATAIARLPDVAWTVPVAFGDRFHGAPVVGTTTAFFDHWRVGDGQGLIFARGRAFRGTAPEAVLGSEVAHDQHLAPGATLVLSHGDGELDTDEHADHPLTVVGILAPTGTPVDHAVHIDLPTLHTLHADGGLGHADADAPPVPEILAQLAPQRLNALLVGLHDRTAVFRVQRAISDDIAPRDGPLMAVLPGVALDELWQLLGGAEHVMQAMTGLVTLVSLASLMAVVLAGLGERRRELAILRAVGASPSQVLTLLALEGLGLTLLGMLTGLIVGALALVLLAPWFAARFGLVLHLTPPDAAELRLLLALGLAGLLAAGVPALRAYRMSLADGLTPRL